MGDTISVVTHSTDPTPEHLIFTNKDLADALARISFKNTVLDFKWKFEWERVFVKGQRPTSSRDGWLLWVSFERPDTITGDVGRGRGRDEIVWAGTSLSGVVKTAWLLVELMVRHELMESFRFDDCRIFNPHNSVIDLANLQVQHEARLQ